MKGKPPSQLDGGWGWLIVFATCVATCCMVGTAKSFGILADGLKDYFNAPQYMVALVFGVSAAIYTFAAPISLIFGEKFTQRKVVMVGGLIGCFGMALSSLSFNLVYIICTFGICFGIGNGCLYGNALVMVGKYFVKRRSLANGIAVAGGSIGQFALPPLIQYFLDTYTVKGALLLLGGIYFHITACGAFLRPLVIEASNTEVEEEFAEDKVVRSGISIQDLTLTVSPDDTIKGDNPCERVNDHDNELCTTVDDSSRLQHSSLLDLPNGIESKPGGGSNSSGCKSSCTIPRFLDFSVLKNRKCLLYSFVMFFMFFGYFNFILFLPTIAATRGVKEYRKAYLVSISGITDLIGRILMGFICDLNLIRRYKIMSACSVVIGANILVFVWTAEYWQMGVQSGIYGFFGGGYIMLVTPVLIDFVGLELLPRALAPVLFLQGTGGAIGQVFLGWIRDQTGSFTMVLVICSVSNLIGGLSILLYPLAKKWEHDRVTKSTNTTDRRPENSAA